MYHVKQRELDCNKQKYIFTRHSITTEKQSSAEPGTMIDMNDPKMDNGLYTNFDGVVCFHDDVIKWNIFRVTSLLCGEFTGHRLILRTKASEAGLGCFLWFAPEPTV